MDAEVGDKFADFGKTITGGVLWSEQESPWATGLGGVKYGRQFSNDNFIAKKLIALGSTLMDNDKNKWFVRLGLGRDYL